MVTEQMQSPPAELDPYKVELSRGMKGQYDWTITVRGKDKLKVMEDIDFINGFYLNKYGEPTKGE
jgi:hypothetical protein